jgi:hypothetical protein
MLTTAQIEHFRTFGFVALPGLLGQYAEVLRREVDTALRDAYATTYDERAHEHHRLLWAENHPLCWPRRR